MSMNLTLSFEDADGVCVGEESLWQVSTESTDKILDSDDPFESYCKWVINNVERHQHPDSLTDWHISHLRKRIAEMHKYTPCWGNC